MIDPETVKKVHDSFVPFGTRVAIAIDPFKYEGRVIIPDTAQALPTTGVIAALGNGVEQTYPGMFTEGDRVLISKYSGTLVSIANKPAFRVLDAGEILGKIAPDDTLEWTGA